MSFGIGSGLIQALGAYATGRKQYEDNQRQKAIQDQQLANQEEDRRIADEQRLRQNQIQDFNQEYQRQEMPLRLQALKNANLQNDAELKKFNDDYYSNPDLEKYLLDSGDLTQNDANVLNHLRETNGNVSKYFVNAMVSHNKEAKANSISPITAPATAPVPVNVVQSAGLTPNINAMPNVAPPVYQGDIPIPLNPRQETPIDQPPVPIPAPRPRPDLWVPTPTYQQRSSQFRIAKPGEKYATITANGIKDTIIRDVNGNPLIEVTGTPLPAARQALYDEVQGIWHKFGAPERLKSKWIDRTPVAPAPVPKNPEKDSSIITPIKTQVDAPIAIGEVIKALPPTTAFGTAQQMEKDGIGYTLGNFKIAEPANLIDKVNQFYRSGGVDYSNDPYVLRYYMDNIPVAQPGTKDAVLQNQINTMLDNQQVKQVVVDGRLVTYNGKLSAGVLNENSDKTLAGIAKDESGTNLNIAKTGETVIKTGLLEPAFKLKLDQFAEVKKQHAIIQQNIDNALKQRVTEFNAKYALLKQRGDIAGMKKLSAGHHDEKVKSNKESIINQGKLVSELQKEYDKAVAEGKRNAGFDDALNPKPINPADQSLINEIATSLGAERGTYKGMLKGSGQLPAPTNTGNPEVRSFYRRARNEGLSDAVARAKIKKAYANKGITITDKDF